MTHDEMSGPVKLSGIGHWWRILTEPSGMNRIRGFGAKRWYVVYRDGNHSVAMSYDEACNYAGLDDNGGTVYRQKEPA